MMNYKLILLMSALLLATVSCKENIDDINEGITKRDYTIVKTSEIIISSKSIPLYAIGRLQSDKDIKLSFKIGGVISGIKADEGDYVRKGQVLAQVRTNEIDAQVLKAQSALNKSKRDLDRVNKMYNEGAATLEQIQDLTTLVSVNQADLDIALFNQQYAQIKSPVSGRIIKRMAEPNELISPGQPVLVLSSSAGGNYIMTASLSDKNIAEVSVGDEAEITFDAFQDENIKGNIVQINESADPRTGTFNVEIQLQPNKLRLRNGTIGRLTLHPKVDNEYGLIPLDAIVETEDDNIVLFSPTQADTTVVEWKAEPVKIIDNYAMVQVSAIQYDKVVTDGSSFLIDGDKIRIAE